MAILHYQRTITHSIFQICISRKTKCDNKVSFPKSGHICYSKLIQCIKVAYLMTLSMEIVNNFVQSLCKELFGIPTLLQNNKEFNTSKNKANLLDTYFKSVFTVEDLSNIPTLETSTYPSVSIIYLVFHSRN